MYLCVGNPIHVYWDAEATRTQPVLPIWQLCGCGPPIAHSVHSGTHTHTAVKCLTHTGRPHAWPLAVCGWHVDEQVLRASPCWHPIAIYWDLQFHRQPLCPNMTSVWVAGMSPQTHPVCVLGPAPTRCMDMDVTLGDSSCVRVATCPNRQQQDPPRRDARNTCASLCLQNTAQHGAHI